MLVSYHQRHTHQHNDQKAADLLLQAQRFGVKEDGSASKELVDSYKSEILVKKDSKIKSLKDLKGKKIALQDVTSTAGYTFPLAMLKTKQVLMQLKI